MRRVSLMRAQWADDRQTGTELHFENCKGGYFSTEDEYGLKVVGKTGQDGEPTLEAPGSIRRVPAGTKVTVTGKNLYDYIDLFSGSRGITVSNGEVSNTYTHAAGGGYSKPFSLRKGTYTFRFEMKTGDMSNTASTDANKFFFIYYATNIKNAALFLSYGKIADYTKRSVQVILDDDSDDFRFKIVLQGEAGHYGMSCMSRNIQIERGDGTDYEPYRCGGQAVTPCDLFEGDRWFPMSGKVERRSRHLVFDGTEDWVITDSYDWGNEYGLVGYPFNGDYTKMVYSTHYKRTETVSAIITDGRFRFQIVNPTVNLYIGDASVSTVEEFKQRIKDWCEAGNPFCIAYSLYKPEIEWYDPQPLFAPMGEVNVIQATTDLPADLAATMWVARKENT